jgi:hypothetical protein
MSIQNQALAAMHFPGKLHDMLTFVEKEGLEAIISWVNDGTAIMIHNPTKLVQILGIFFSQTKYRSFRRQLSGWFFERIQEGPSKGAFIHPYFRRGEIALCDLMSRHRPPPKVACAHSVSDEKTGNRKEISNAIDSNLMPSPADFSSQDNPKRSSSSQATEEILAVVESVMRDTEPRAFREGFDGSRLQHLDFSSHDIQQISSSCRSAIDIVTVAEAVMGDFEPSEFRQGLDGSRMQHPDFSSHDIQHISSSCQATIEIDAAAEAAMGDIEPIEFREGMDGRRMQQHEHINDGDLVRFAGRSFHFLDFAVTFNDPS